MDEQADNADGEEPRRASEDDARSPAEKLVGTIISDRYRLHNLLALGGMGAVYTGEHVHMRKRVAIKLLHKDMQGQAGLVARFEREAIVGAHVEHANVASARDFGRLPDGSCYLVLEFVRGVTLRQLINQGPLSVPRAIRIAKQLALALGAVHERGIVHRDVAPRNVMVVPGPEDRVKLIDFGFAKVPVERFRAMSVQGGTPILPSEITPVGIIFGTIGYLAPEGVLGMAAVTERSDLYALGAIFYELLAGVGPFEAPTQATLFLKHRMEPVPRIRERAPAVDVPVAVEAIARRLLEKKPADRFASAQDVVRALDEVSAGLAPESHDAAGEAEELQLTVLGAEPPASLPRIEDVADVELLELEGSDAPDAPDEADAPDSARRSAPPASRPPRAAQVASDAAPSSRRWLVLGLGVIVLGGAAVLLGQRYGLSGIDPYAPPPPRTDLGATSPAAPARPAASVSASGQPGPARPTAVASASPTASPTEVDGLDAEAWKRVVRQAPSTNDYERALAGLLALGELDPKALDKEDMRSTAAETTVRFGADKERGPKLFDALVNRFGEDGIDVLYELVSRRGGSRSAALAGETLARPEVRARGSKALRIALELREASCAGKLALVERARTDADARGLAILVATRGEACESAGCCLRENAAVDGAIRDIVKRTSAP